jgi:hypothetical protein
LNILNFRQQRKCKGSSRSFSALSVLGSTDALLMVWNPDRHKNGDNGTYRLAPTGPSLAAVAGNSLRRQHHKAYNDDGHEKHAELELVTTIHCQSPATRHFSRRGMGCINSPNRALDTRTTTAGRTAAAPPPP